MSASKAVQSAREEESAKKQSRELLAIIRIRGVVNVRPEVATTLRLLRLARKYHMTVYPADRPGLKGMLHKAKDWIAWGEIDREVLIEVLRRRGRAPGSIRITDEYIREKLGLGGVEELVDKLYSGELELYKLEHVIKPVFRLAPPRGGFKKSIKRPFKDGGELGYRGREINKLILRMI
uniref:Large ribosomal subunit protein uL30 n=1 Tax=Fervidicoccus fontis TaxID=683846 RepID=A0A7J3ZKE3_9CREN